MDTELKIEYHIRDMLDRRTKTDIRAEAEAWYGDGMFVDEVHITEWKAPERGISGKHVVIYDWDKPK